MGNLFCCFIAVPLRLCYTGHREPPTRSRAGEHGRGVPRREVTVMKLFTYADQYLKQSSWKDLALVKFCLCAMGVLIGLAVPRSRRRQFAFGAAVVFLTTYLPLMSKFAHVVVQTRREEELAAAEETADTAAEE